MKPSNLEQQLLQVHRSIQNWEHCKSDLQAATRALTNATGLLRWCLDAWPPAPTVSALQPPGLSLPGLTSSGDTCADGLPGDADVDADADADAAPIGAANPRVINQSNQLPLDGTNCPSVGEARQVPQVPTAASDVHDWGRAPKTQELLALVCQELAQAQYLHALALCAGGYCAAADPWVAGLGYRLRLSDEVWAACADSVGHLAGARAAGPFDAASWSSDITGSMEHSPAPDVSPSKSGNPFTAVPSLAPKPFSTAAKIATAVAAGEYDLSTESIAPKPCVARVPEGGTMGLVSDPVPPALPPLICDDVLPMALLYRLAAAFDPAGATPYWRQHRYGERETPFFSYLYRLDQPTTSSSASFTGVVEAAIQLLYRRLLREGTHRAGEGKGKAEEGGEINMPTATTAAAAAAGRVVASALHGVVVAEWWAHTRDPTAAHQLHFDVNEDVLRRGLADYQLAHPVLSSVLFLPPASPAIRACRHPEAAAAAADAAAEAAEVEPGPGVESWGASLESRPSSRWERRGSPGGPTLVLDQTPAGARVRVELSEDTGCGRMTPSSLPVSSSSAPNTSAHTTPAAAITPTTVANAAAGPTCGRLPLARRAWAIGPWPNRLLIFPGNLLHGVMPQPVPTQPLPRSSPPSAPPSGPEQHSVPPQKQPLEDRFLNKQPQHLRSGSRYGAGGVAAVAGASRTTLIVAWWGAERLRTATSAPPLAPPGSRGDMGPQLPVARYPGEGAGDEDGLAAVTDTTGEGGQDNTRGEGVAGEEGRKRRWVAAVSDAGGLLEAVHKVEKTGLEAAMEEEMEEDVVERARVRRRRLMLQLEGVKGGGGVRVDDDGGRAAITNTNTNTNTIITTAPITSGGSGSESDGSSSGRSSSDNSGSTGETPTCSGSPSRSSDVSIEDDDEDDNDDVDREEDNDEDEDDEDPEQHQCGDGGTGSMGKVTHRRPYILDWRYAGPLRPGMLLPPLTTPDGLLLPNRDRSPRPQSLESQSQQLGKVSGIAPHDTALAESPACGNDRSRCISGVTGCAQGVPAGSPPPTNRLVLSWRHWFAALRAHSSLASANRVGISGMESGEDGGKLAPLQWRMPLCISPAWVPVKRPPRDLRWAANSGAAATISSVASVASADAAVPAAAAVDDSEAWGPAKAQEGSSRGVEQAEGDLPLPSPAPTRICGSDWGLGQQAVRGMAIALGLAQAMGTVKRPRRQKQASGMKQLDGVEGREEKSEEEGEEGEEEQEEEGDSGEEQEQAGVSALRCVMVSLELPSLRVFLRHPRELERLYLPLASSAGIDSLTHQ